MNINLEEIRDKSAHRLLHRHQRNYRVLPCHFVLSADNDVVFGYYPFPALYTVQILQLSNFKSKSVDPNEVNFDAAVLLPKESI